MKVTLYKIEFEDTIAWNCDTLEKFQKMQEPYRQAGLTLTEFDPENNYQNLIDDQQTLIFDKSRMAEFAIAGLQIKSVETMETEVDISKQLSAMAEKQVAFKQPTAEWNEKCEVHIAGHSLSTYNDLMLMEDACTDELQINLNKGWRILAACPQPDQRRPDYVLGRWNADIEIENRAARG